MSKSAQHIFTPIWIHRPKHRHSQASMDPCSILLYCCVCESIYVMASTGRPQDNYEKLFLSSYLYQVLESKLRSSGWTAAPLPPSRHTPCITLSSSSFLGGRGRLFLSFFSFFFLREDLAGLAWNSYVD